VDSIFAAPTLAEALDLVKEHSRGFWYVIKGTRGDTGRKAIKPQVENLKDYL
jgi:tryptophan synthase alpha subunit